MSKAAAWGVVDSGASAAATFLAGVVAIAILTPAQLAVYSLVFSGTLIATLLPQQLVYLPARVAANLLPERAVPALALTMKRAIGTNVLAVFVVSLSGFPGLAHISFTDVAAFALGGIALVLLSPLQAHLRACLHLAGMHPSAATSSVLSTAVTGTILLVSPVAFGIATPFFALAAGYLASIAVSSFFLRSTPRAGIDRAPQRPLRARAGYLASDLLIQGAWYASSLIVLGILGAPALATLEAARVASAPVFVFANGVATATIPAIVRAFQVSPRSGRRKLTRLTGVVYVLGSGYAVIIYFAVPTISALLDRPISAGLSAARTIGSTAEGASNILSSPMYATNGQWRWTRATAGGVLVTLTILPLLLITPVAVFGLPLAQASGMLIRAAIGWRSLKRL